MRPWFRRPAERHLLLPQPRRDSTGRERAIVGIFGRPALAEEHERRQAQQAVPLDVACVAALIRHVALRVEQAAWEIVLGDYIEDVASAVIGPLSVAPFLEVTRSITLTYDLHSHITLTNTLNTTLTHNVHCDSISAVACRSLLRATPKLGSLNRVSEESQTYFTHAHAHERARAHTNLLFLHAITDNYDDGFHEHLFIQVKCTSWKT